MASNITKWFQLNDPSGARLKLASINGVTHLFIMGLPHIHPQSHACIRVLGFNRVPSKSYLVRQAQSGERLSEASLRKVFPMARMVDMDRADFVIEQSSRAGTAMVRRMDVDLRGLTRLGRNAAGEIVSDSPSGRLIVADTGHKRLEADSAEIAWTRWDLAGA